MTHTELVNDIIEELDLQDPDIILQIHRMIFGDCFKEDQIDWEK